MPKESRLKLLARLRQHSRWTGCLNIADFHDGAYETEYVSPYTKSASNADSPILVLLQDWVSADFLEGPIRPELISQGRDPDLPTNRNLDRLLEHHFNIEISEIYATNLFPFVKAADMSARIPNAWLRRAAREFAIPLIEVIAPRLVIALGLATFGALAGALGEPRPRNLNDALDAPLQLGITSIWCQAHTGGLGQANRNRGRVDRSFADWARMSRWYSAGV